MKKTTLCIAKVQLADNRGACSPVLHVAFTSAHEAAHNGHCSLARLLTAKAHDRVSEQAESRCALAVIDCHACHGSYADVIVAIQQKNP
ncbi:hypothetical protein [Xanthomonas campestris]|uniref:hypothetical protein n=1 Tax=Xanthomonas campestris TaxID=339 RepID=UPI00388ED203